VGDSANHGTRLPQESLCHNPLARVHGVPDHDVDTWEPLRTELAAEVDRVADRLRSMSQARLAGMPAQPENNFPPYHGRAQAGRTLATELAHLARCLEAAASGGTSPPWLQVPELSDFAAGDQVAVAGHDLLAALDLVGPDDEVWFDTYGGGPARTGVERVQRLLGDLRRRL
jgi:hypothetical protein